MKRAGQAPSPWLENALGNYRCGIVEALELVNRPAHLMERREQVRKLVWLRAWTEGWSTHCTLSSRRGYGYGEAIVWRHAQKLG